MTITTTTSIVSPVDASGNLKTDLITPLPAGTNSIGFVGTPAHLLATEVNLGLSANAFITGANINPVGYSGRIRLRMWVQTATVITMYVQPQGTSTSTAAALNSGNALSVNVWYEFDFAILSGDAINFAVGAATTLSYILDVIED